MSEEYKEYDLLPCPWCENPVHVESIGVHVVGQEVTVPFGFYITCGHYGCDCPAVDIRETRQEAIDEWNNGNTFKKIKEVYHNGTSV